MFGRKKQQPKPETNLEDRQAELEKEMEHLKSFISGGAEQEHLDKINTMPPPDDFDQRARELERVENILTKKEVKNIRKQQANGLLLFSLLIIAIICMSAWVFRVYTEKFGSPF